MRHFAKVMLMEVLNSWSMFSMKVAVCCEGVEQLVHVLNEGGRVL